ncbi:MAG: toll/interleukin-1 receptor domain-containing protein, partial [Anaerolineaceae bacterium]|nr:toll/interleukin-1 receptor domain-containing protein [Anaerolineaceae bacterium]
MAADQVVRAIEAGGVSCWVAPRDIQPGASWGSEILAAIEASKIFVLVFSSSSNDSPQAIREVEAALMNNVVILPLRIEDV